MLNSTAGDQAACPACLRPLNLPIWPTEPLVPDPAAPGEDMAPPVTEGRRFKAVLLDMADDEERRAESCDRAGDVLLRAADEPGIVPSVAAARQMEAEERYEARDIARVHAEALRHAASLIC